MSFISIKFVFFFLPITLGIWIALTRKGILSPAPIIFLSLASAFFYADGNLRDMMLLTVSALVNYVLAVFIASATGRMRLNILICGVLLNCLFLTYYKYLVFLSDVVFQATGFQLQVIPPSFPIGISFYTLQQVAYLVVVNRYGRAEKNLWDYLSFVFFFPKLTAGPIVYASEYFGQLNEKWGGHRTRFTDISIGITLFCFGAFKKIVLSEPLGQTANQAFGVVGHDSFSLISAWVGIAAYTLQLYFDFSGYSDMAIGVARMFGFKLPQNFNSPLRATSLLGFWRGWHLTMTRFFMDHVYNPIAIRLTRHEVAASSGAMRMFLITVVFPTTVTFLVSGIWHGAGWTFIFFGLIHGVGLSINQAWRVAKLPALPAPVGWGLMFVTVMASLVFVRASDLPTALTFLKTMVSYPLVWPDWLGSLAAHLPGSVGAVPGLSRWSAAYLVLSFGIILLLPNPKWLLRQYVPTLQYKAISMGGGIFNTWSWSPTIPWALVAACALSAAILNMYGQSPFIYFAF